MRGRGLESRCVSGTRFTFGVAAAQQFVGAVLNPAGHIGVGRPAVGRIVFEAAVLGRIVRRRDDDAVGEMILAGAVVNQDGARNDRRGRHAVIGLDERLDAVGGEHFERGALGRGGQRMGVFAHVKRSVDAAGCRR